MLCESIIDTIGHTPVVHLNQIEKLFNLKAGIYAKVEFFNPSGSIKDRAAISMINQAKKQGLIRPNTVIIEETSGNTGIALSMICAREGLKLIIVMPDSMSKERIKMMTAYGAEVILSDGRLGMKGAVDKVREIEAKYPDHFTVSQFDNSANPLAHYQNTVKELLDDLGEFDALVAGIGTGGTISGIAEYLADGHSKTRIIGVEPVDSPLLTKGHSGPHKIQGIGANFLPHNLKSELLDAVYDVSYEDALALSRLLSTKEGIFAGISSGAALFAAICEAKKPENAGKKIVVILPDSKDRYLSLEEL